MDASENYIMRVKTFESHLRGFSNFPTLLLPCLGFVESATTTFIISPSSEDKLAKIDTLLHVFKVLLDVDCVQTLPA